jgi:hypothetical protein
MLLSLHPCCVAVIASLLARAQHLALPDLPAKKWARFRSPMQWIFPEKSAGLHRLRQ